jgi:hypothetical protein
MLKLETPSPCESVVVTLIEGGLQSANISYADRLVWGIVETIRPPISAYSPTVFMEPKCANIRELHNNLSGKYWSAGYPRS